MARQINCALMVRAAKGTQPPPTVEEVGDWSFFFSHTSLDARRRDCACKHILSLGHALSRVSLHGMASAQLAAAQNPFSSHTSPVHAATFVFPTAFSDRLTRPLACFTNSLAYRPLCPAGAFSFHLRAQCQSLRGAPPVSGTVEVLLGSFLELRLV